MNKNSSIIHTAVGGKTTMKMYEKWYQEHEKKILEEFFTYLRFPSVSAQKARVKDVLACADWVEQYLKGMGFHTERWTGKGHPVLFGEMFFDKKYPTILFYGHYDVQPAEPFELWQSPPFEPQIREGRVYARGAEDNKGQNFYTLTAIKAYLERHPNPRLNFKFIIEGEEEMGSVTITEILPSKKDRLKADHLLVVDMGMGSFEHPSLSIGCRGIMTMEVTLTAMHIDAHSGALGGIVYSPNRALVEILSKAINEKGTITIPHFYDSVVSLSEAERAHVDLTFHRTMYEEDLGLKSYHQEIGYSPMESNYFRPTFEINGIWGGYTGDGFKTVIPKEAHAKISCRLVPKQDSVTVFNQVCDFINDHLPQGMEATYHFHGGGEAAWASPKSKTVTVMRRAYEEVFGSSRLILGGGSVPITSDLARYSGANFALPGTALESDNIHAPNENFSLKQLRYGFLMIAKSLELFSEM